MRIIADHHASENISPVPPPSTGAPSPGYDPTTMPDSLGNPPIVHRPYPLMPDRADWLENLPPSLVDEQTGFELRLVEELAAVGIRTYELSPLSKLRPLPTAVPIVVDWLEHLDERIPGAEGRGVTGSPESHKRAVHTSLLISLNDRSARGNRRARDILVAELRRNPPLPEDQSYFAARALATVAGPADFDLILGLFEAQPRPNEVAAGLLEYVGRQKSQPLATTVAAGYLGDAATRNYAIDALGKLKSPGAAELIEPFTNDADPYTRKLAERTMKKLRRAG
ncbi:hypothetical protein ACFYTF_05155 [Nocardia thailandica]|uniref:HEAT repeat domain-containing protein n=1 Tax=Nocardia thailandica TaxID=257275 RepID=A0ABW6PIQ5_9NOCA